jgi:CPA2 family monovalent cation:H+ antiporter-2
MHLDPAMGAIVGALFLILAVGLALRFLRQPHVVAYLIAGVLIGPGVTGLFMDTDALTRLGAVGVVLLLFFIGMEVSPRRLASNWKVSIVGTLLQILISIAFVWVVGAWLDWPFGRVLMLGFVISLSSTAVVLKILSDWNELDTPVGQDAVGILLVQDFAVVPMLIILDQLGGGSSEHSNIWLQVTGGVVILAILAYLAVREEIRLPLLKWLKRDEELQLFGALSICFGIALLTGWMGLSTALGAFLAGMIIGAARETQWVHHSLAPFRVVLLAIFFVSIGMMLDLQFLAGNLALVLSLVFVILVVNTFINAGILRLLGDPWKETLYAGALLAQIGEFSFVLAAVGINSHAISEYGYQLVISTIAVSLLLSPAWIMLVRRLLSLPPPQKGVPGKA